jgi:hypothetical protein
MGQLVDIEYGTRLTAITCGNCHIPFGLPAAMLKARQEDGGYFWCPNGHQIHYYETELDKLRKEKDRLQRVAESRAESLRITRGQRDAAQRSASALKGVVTKTKKRIGNGTCPCCNRHFANVERHMQSQHPEYADIEQVTGA